MAKSNLKKVKISDLDRMWHRPRIVDPSAVLAVSKSIESLGLLTPPTVSEKTMRVLSLASVVEAYVNLGRTEIEVWIVDLTPDEELEAFFTLNNHWNTWEWQAVSETLKDMVKRNSPVLLAGFGPGKTKALTRAGDWAPPEATQLDGEQAKQTGFAFD